MKSKSKPDAVILALGASAVITLLLVTGLWGWYRAGLEADVYSRQGVKMSQWECFVGVKPIERTINVK